MSPLRARMIEDMTLAGLALGRRKSTFSRCARWQRITGVHRTSSARKRCGSTCSACARVGLPAARSRPASTASVSSLALRLDNPLAASTCHSKGRQNL